MGPIRYLTTILLVLGACQPGDNIIYPSNRAESIAESVFKIAVDGGSGTAWVFKTDNEGSYLITAGHVCEGSNEFTLIARDGTEYVALELMRSDEPDLCELFTPTKFPALPIASVLPKYDEDLITVGAPGGMWGGGIAPVYHLHYSGGVSYTGTVYPGLSGAPVLSVNGVVGVTVLGLFPAQFAFMVTAKTLSDWLDGTNVSP